MMFDALDRVIRSKGRLGYLRDLFYSHQKAETFTFAAMRFPYLNATQEEAVNRVLRAKDVAIVHGPPGTGKTTTLVEAIYETLRREPQVLVCAQSNMAVDWISEKLVDRGVPVLRIGNPTRVNDKMLSFTYERRFESHPDYELLWAIRKAIRDRRATETEVMAMMRDQAFGSKSEQVVEGTTIDDLNKGSLETYRNRIRNDNPTFPYKDLSDDQFCEKVGILKEGRLTIGGILMLGQRDVVQRHVSNFWIDYLEIPGTSLADAQVRYTFRMQEQDNIWESYQIILQRLRNFVDAPYEARPDGVGAEDESQLYTLREGLTNCCAHADYFSPMHPTIRVFTDRIELQNPGRFMFPLSELRTQIHSIPRNPNIIKFFRYAKLGENAGYGIDKMLAWERLTKGKVEFTSDLVCSTITYWFGEQAGGQAIGQAGEQPMVQASGQASGQVQILINCIRDKAFSIVELQKRIGIKSRRYVREEMLVPAIKDGYVLLAYPDKPRHPNQRYFLSEKGLKLVK